MTLSEPKSMLDLVSRLKADGYFSVHWKQTAKGLRADVQGKISIPADDNKMNICMIHGNAVKLRCETYLGQQDRGFRILAVHPCFLCATADPGASTPPEVIPAPSEEPKRLRAATMLRIPRRVPRRSGLLS